MLLADPRIDPSKPKNDGTTPFYLACEKGRKEIVSLLLADPRIDPDKAEKGGKTPFFAACQKGHQAVVSLLLADPRVDPNKGTNEGATPLWMSCYHLSVVLLLLADPRVDPNKPTDHQASPLWIASFIGHLVVVQHLLASDRDINTTMVSTDTNLSAAKQGRFMPMVPRGDNESEEEYQQTVINGPLCGDLIDEYAGDPVAVRHRLRRQPGVREHFVGHLFALVVFHSDDFVVINERASSFTRRFFKITSRLPLDLQMLLCNRVFGSPKDIILSKHSEPYFKCLARTTTWQQ